MKTYLDEAIEEFEKEKINLQNTIADYLADEDYQYAAYHQKALKQVGRQLDILYEFQSSGYPRIAAHQQLVKNMQHILQHIDMVKPLQQSISQELEQMIQDTEQEISDLSAVQKPSVHKEDKQDIDNALFDLAEGKIAGFRLYFSDDSLFLDFRLNSEKDEMEIAFTPGAHEGNQYSYFSIRHPGPVNLLGFRLENTNELVYRHNIIGFKDATAIKIILARVCYDFLYTRKENWDLRLVFNNI